MDSDRLGVEIARLSGDELEGLALRMESAVARARHIQTLVVREADRRQVPLGDGCRDLAEWVAGRLDVSHGTARGLVRVARREVDALDAALAAGVVSFDRVEAAARTDDADLYRHLDISGVRRLAARRERIDRDSEIRGYGRRSLAYQRDMFGTAGRLWAEGPALETDAIFSAIESAADDLPAPPEGHPDSVAARRFDGLVSLALGEAGDQQVNTTVIVDATDASATNGESGSWLASGPRIGPATLERILCESPVDIIVRTDDGTPLAVGDSRTAIPPRVRRWVLARDGGACTADGCRSTARLQPHHVRHRAHQGDNHHDNLATLCWFHHHVVIHGRGFTIDPDSPPQRRRLLPPHTPTNSPP